VAKFALYSSLLGAAWTTLPKAVRACHEARLVAFGQFTVEHKSSFVARMLIAFAALPPAGKGIALRLDVESGVDHQIWTRDFAGFVMTTHQSMLADGRLAERRGPLELLFRVSVEKGTIVYRPDGIRVRIGRLAIPVPRWLGPRVAARAWAEGSAMRVKVEIAAPLLGTVVTYGGLLAAREDPAAPDPV
jgi:hypothetical protein